LSANADDTYPTLQKPPPIRSGGFVPKPISAVTSNP
jgi:hypothetical protein